MERAGGVLSSLMQVVFYSVGGLRALEKKVPTMLLKRMKFFRGVSGKNIGDVKFLRVVGKVVCIFVMDVFSCCWIFCLSQRRVVKQYLPLNVWRQGARNVQVRVDGWKIWFSGICLINQRDAAVRAYSGWCCWLTSGLSTGGQEVMIDKLGRVG